MASSIEPTKDYLKKYESPLWEILGLESAEPVTIVEGKRGVYPFTIIEIQHDAHRGAFSVRQRMRSDISTFFIITLPNNTRRRVASYPVGAQVSVDSRHLYLTIPGIYQAAPDKKRNRDNWDETLQQAITVAEGLEEGPAEVGKFHGAEPAYSQVGTGPIATRMIAHVFLFLAVAFTLHGLGLMTGLLDRQSSTCIVRGKNGCERYYHHQFTREQSFNYGVKTFLVGLFVFSVSGYGYHRAAKRREIDNARMAKQSGSN